MIIETTPPSVTPEIIKFCKSIAGKKAGRPLYIAVCPEDNCNSRFCFPNVRAKVRTSGGFEINGWIIWKRGNMYLYAEAHAVWKSPEGNLIDITPKEDGEEQILFLPDDRVDYKGYSIPSKFRQLTNSQLVRDFIRKKEIIYLYQSDINHKGISDQEYDRSSRLVAEYQQLFARDVGEEDPCPCGSGLKYKQCCSPNRA